MHACIWFSAFFLLLPITAHSQDANSRWFQEFRAIASRRIAICIGISHYTDKNLNTLKKAANDTYGPASVLEKQGDFKTYVFADLNKDVKEKSAAQRTSASEETVAGIRMVPIPSGTFEMGSNYEDAPENPFKGKGFFKADKPVHTVTLSGFSMSATEITQGQYKAVMGTNPSKFTGDDNLPVEMVSWRDAIKFCNILSDKAGLSRCYDESSGACDFTKNGFRLPTEAE